MHPCRFVIITTRYCLSVNCTTFYKCTTGNTYEISISVVEGTENDSEALQPFIELRNQMDGYLPNNNVKLKLVVEYIDNVVKVLK